MTPEEKEAAKTQRDDLRAQIESLPDGVVKDAVRKALEDVDRKLEEDGNQAKKTSQAEQAEAGSSSGENVEPKGEQKEDAEEKEMTPTVVHLLREANYRPQNKKEFFVAALHCIMTESGFSAVEGQNDTNAVSVPGFAPPVIEKVSESLLPKDWNRHANDGTFSFRYFHKDLGRTVAVLKCLYMGDRLHVHASRADKQDIYSLEINVPDFVHMEKSVHDGLNGLLFNMSRLRGLVDTEIVKKLLAPRRLSNSGGRSIDFDEGEDRSPAIIPPLSRGEPPGAFPGWSARDERRGDFDGDLFPGGLRGPGGFGVGGGGGSGVGIDHPVFRGPPSGPGVPGVPPGARFDPFGPFPGPGIPGSHRDPTRPVPGGFGEPDPDHLPMPGRPSRPNLPSSRSSPPGGFYM